MQNKSKVVRARTNTNKSRSRVPFELDTKGIVAKLMEELPTWWEEENKNKKTEGKK